MLQKTRGNGNRVRWNLGFRTGIPIIYKSLSFNTTHECELLFLDTREYQALGNFHLAPNLVSVTSFVGLTWRERK